ncbi:class I SAM-dependent methyltransferase [Lentzea aerocolonigenes]|uniref:class I SAM-dependent methyltransferase n=1 Tax=Lentzea aerocolonigenes TaxID=68170 RepID=UPI0004C4244D|nr:class I SAM-dependent methyltransferase [Lentzea aerocolonigenes]MCP2246367.1 Methyltransferase domain-containing protein [Lentzea aerocolonigenes]
MHRHIRSVDDVLTLLDGLFDPGADRWTERAGDWWDRFYADREREVPFFVAKPDESLVSYLERGLIAPGRALDVGCGPGRNAIHLARNGFQVDAVDVSATAIAWASERGEGLDVRFRHGDAFATTGTYDLIYDSGCFHHLPPHRRVSYLALLDRALAPGGHFALTCFTAEEGTSTPDAELYRQGGLAGGVGYEPDELRWIFQDLTEVELRRMTDQGPDSPAFGKSFLWTALFRRG